MTVLDAYAVLAYLRGEAVADDVADLLGAPTILSVVNAAEVLDQLVRVYGRDADDVHADLALLASTGMELTSVSADVGLLAGRLRARHYHRERMAVSLADCVAAATAMSWGRALATADPALAALVRAEGGSVHALADSGGALP
ncbi:MAG: PIN domain-containing protein [Jiangellaceae bacterium]